MGRAFRLTWAVIPMKSYGRAKSRLSAVLLPEQRAALARSMFLHVLGVVQPFVDGILVATDGDDVASDAQALGARVLRDAHPTGLAEVVDRALAILAADGAESALVLMGDLPGLGGADLESLLTRTNAGISGEPRPHRVAAPDLAGTGTNALWLPLNEPFLSAFGRSDSFAQHRRGAAIVSRSGFAFDLDTPADWVLWKESRDDPYDLSQTTGSGR